MTIKTRLETLERAGANPSGLVISVFLQGEDSAGNAVLSGGSVNGPGWSAKQGSDESEDDFRERARTIAAKHGCVDLWDGSATAVAIGGENDA